MTLEYDSTNGKSCKIMRLPEEYQPSYSPRGEIESRLLDNSKLEKMYANTGNRGCMRDTWTLEKLAIATLLDPADLIQYLFHIHGKYFYDQFFELASEKEPPEILKMVNDYLIRNFRNSKVIPLRKELPESKFNPIENLQA